MLYNILFLMLQHFRNYILILRTGDNYSVVNSLQKVSFQVRYILLIDFHNTFKALYQVFDLFIVVDLICYNGRY